jgi:hypothetical protein
LSASTPELISILGDSELEARFRTVPNLLIFQMVLPGF